MALKINSGEVFIKMVKKKNKVECCKNFGSMCKEGGCGGVYFVGFIGAAIYYIVSTTGFWAGVWGVIKALVWPAFLVFELMKYIGM